MSILNRSKESVHPVLPLLPVDMIMFWKVNLQNQPLYLNEYEIHPLPLYQVELLHIPKIALTCKLIYSSIMYLISRPSASDFWIFEEPPDVSEEEASQPFQSRQQRNYLFCQ